MEWAMCGIDFQGKALDKISCIVDNRNMPE